MIYLFELTLVLKINRTIKAGIFDGPQIRSLINNNDFINHMTKVESEAWTSFVSVVKNFLGNHKAAEYSKIVAKILVNLKKNWELI